jgi:hypothetical protein
MSEAAHFAWNDAANPIFDSFVIVSADLPRPGTS